MSRKQKVIRLTRDDFNQLVLIGLHDSGFTATKVANYVMNPYSDSVDIIVEDDSFEELASLAVPEVVDSSERAKPSDWAM